MSELSLGGTQSDKHIEYHNPDFAYIPRHRGAPAAAHKVAHWNNEQYVMAKVVKKEVRKGLDKSDWLWIKWRGRNPYTHMVIEHPPTAADGKGWRPYIPFKDVKDEDCNFSERPVTTWTNPKTNQTIENALWPGSGDRFFTVDELLAMPPNLTTFQIAERCWAYFPSHAYREAVEQIRAKALR